MRRGLVAVLALALAPAAASAVALQDVAGALEVAKVTSLEYSGTGRRFQFGQAPAPSEAWPAFDVSRYAAAIDYQAPGARVQITRLQVVDPGRPRPVPVEQRVDQYVSGTNAWNRPVAPANPPSAELYSIAGNTHNDSFALAYVPAEKLLIQADAFNPTAANVPPPASPNPYSVNLYENIQKLKLDVAQIIPLHGPRLVTVDDLRIAIGQAPIAQ